MRESGGPLFSVVTDTNRDRRLDGIVSDGLQYRFRCWYYNCWKKVGGRWGELQEHIKLCFHSLASSCKAVLRTQKGPQHTEHCESSITSDGIEAENFILRKERKWENYSVQHSEHRWKDLWWNGSGWNLSKYAQAIFEVNVSKKIKDQA